MLFFPYQAAAAQQAVSCSFRLHGAVIVERHAVSALKGAAPVLARRAPYLHAHTFRAKARALCVGAATPIRAIKVIPHVRFATVRVRIEVHRWRAGQGGPRKRRATPATRRRLLRTWLRQKA